MNNYAVDLNTIAILVKTDEKITRQSFSTKKQADKKLLDLIAAGYTFDPYLWAARKGQLAILHVQAHHLCNALCHKLYDWNPGPEQKARLEHTLARARVRLARRERLS